MGPGFQGDGSTPAEQEGFGILWSWRRQAAAKRMSTGYSHEIVPIPIICSAIKKNLMHKHQVLFF